MKKINFTYIQQYIRSDYMDIEFVIETSDFPELNGKSDQEITDWVLKNGDKVSVGDFEMQKKKNEPISIIKIIPFDSNRESLNACKNQAGRIHYKDSEVKDVFSINSSSLILNHLTHAPSVSLPDDIEGNLELNGLSNAQGLKLPKFVSGDLLLNGLENADKLVLPKNVGGLISLNGLRSVESLVLSDPMSLYIGGFSFNGISKKEKDEFNKRYPYVSII